MSYEYEDELARARDRRNRRGDPPPRQGDNRSRGKQYKRKKPGRSKIKVVLVGMLILLGLLLGGVYLFISGKFGLMANVDFDADKVVNTNLSAEQLEAMKGYWNIACFGVDSRDMKLGKGTNADVNMIISINRKTGEIKLVSIFRDTYLNISDKDSYNKINAAYAQGGPTQAVGAINKNLGLNISDYATFNWKAVADAINILGGIEVELSDAEFYYINSFITETVNETGVYSTHLEHAGLNHLDGVQAVAYGRLRLMDTDYARTERQRIVLSKAFEKAKEADWATLNNIIETVLPQVATSVEPKDIIPMAWDLKKYHLGETSGFPTARGESKKIGKVTDTVVPQTLESNVVTLHQFLFGEENYQVPGNVKEIANHIAEVSGMTTEGKPVGHVPTDRGVIPKKKASGKAAPETAAPAVEETTPEETTVAEETTPEETTPEETTAGETAGAGPGAVTSTTEAPTQSGPGYEDGPGPDAVNPTKEETPAKPSESEKPVSPAGPGGGESQEAGPGAQ